MRLSVVWTARWNIAARIEGSGCPPWIVSRIARKTKKAASDVASRVTTKLLIKFARSLCRFAIHPVPIPPAGRFAGTPNEGNQLISPGIVRNTIAQNIHFANVPPTTAAGPPSLRRLTPARIRHSTAADGASSSINLMKSLSNCGVAMLQSQKGVATPYGTAPALPPIQGQDTPPVPCWIQNSRSRVRPETIRRPIAVNANRENPRPAAKEAIAANAAPPAPTGAITLPTQLIRFSHVPSG